MTDDTCFTPYSQTSLSPTGPGVLDGLRFGAKDLFDVAGFRTGAGNPDWLATHDNAPHTASAIERLLRKGAMLAGRTLTDELAWSLNGINHHFGTPPNPAAPGCIAGGSSCGSASAVAQQQVDFALGTDTGGSVRIPAAFCGLYGIRTSHGRLPMDGCVPLAPSLDTVGWFSRDAITLRRVGRAYFGGGDAVVRPSGVLLAEDALDCVHPDIAVATRRLADRLDATPVRIFEDEPDRFAESFRVLQSGEAWRTHGAWVERASPQFGPGVRERFAYARTVTDADLTVVYAHRERQTRRLNRLLAGNAVLLLPSAPVFPLSCDSGETELAAFRSATMILTSPAGLARLPQVTLPLHHPTLPPMGVGAVAAWGGDELLLELAADLSLTGAE